MHKSGFGVALAVLLLLTGVQVFGNGNPYQIWVPYVESPPIVFDGYIDTLLEWADAGRYDISDLRGSMGDPPNGTGSVFLYASHDSLYLRIAVANLVDPELKEGDVVKLYVDDDNNDTLEKWAEGHYRLVHYLNGDSLMFFPYGAGRILTEFDIHISDLSGHVCYECAIRLGSIEDYDLACFEGASFGAWIGVEEEQRREHSGVWPPTSNFLLPKHYGDVYLARPDETSPPASPSNVTVGVNRPDTVVIQWINPTLNMVGDPLQGLDLVRIFRSGVQIDSLPANPPGAEMRYEDTNVQLARSYSYRLSALDFDALESPLTEPQYAVPGYLYYFSDFEYDDGGWSSAEDSTWEWGMPLDATRPGRPYSGAKCWATILDGYYGSNARSLLTSFPISIEDFAVSRGVLYLYHFYETEAGFDGGNIKISIDSGESWSILEPEGEYPIDEIEGLDKEPGFGGPSGTWVYSVFDLSDYVGETIQMRFDFGSDGSTEYPGWYLDDVGVVTNSPRVGVQEVRSPGRTNVNGTMLTVGPNPSRGRATIAYQLSRPERVGLYIYDLAGRRIITLHEGNQKAGTCSSIWDGTDRMGVGVSSGVYICRLNIGASFKAEKLLLIK